MNDMLKLALDTMHGRVQGDFSAHDKSESIREALIEANGGSTAINFKTFHRGNKVFDFIEELIPYVVEEGLKGDEFFFDYVDYRNIADGDAIEFYSEDPTEFCVAEIANGTQALRRQRLDAGESVTIKQSVYGIKVYEELRRLMAGRVDFNTFIDKVSKAVVKAQREAIFTAFNGITATTAGLNDTYVISGSMDEDALLELVEHIEARTGKVAKIVGTKTALRKLKTATVGDEYMSDMYHMGHYGRWNGIELIALKQLHKERTDEFMLDNNKLYVIAADDKFIKFVNQGEGMIINGDPYENQDLSQEYTYIQSWGIAVMFNSVMGIYTITD